jgi:hypothetical protein
MEKKQENRLDNQTRLEVLSEALKPVRDGGLIMNSIYWQLRDRHIIPRSRLDCGHQAKNIVFEYFPELPKYKPKGAYPQDNRGWFWECGIENSARRAEVMERLIAEIAEQEPENIAVGY